MRMWMLPTEILCKKHLLGEHGEIHKHRHNFIKGHRIDGRLKPFVAIEPLLMGSRHDELALEMIKRGYIHKSPYLQPDLSNYDYNMINVKADLEYNLNDLLSRCSECEKRYKEIFK